MAALRSEAESQPLASPIAASGQKQTKSLAFLTHEIAET